MKSKDNTKRNIRLSFCIPTYNFAEFLPETLDSIISQDNGQIEIVIVDGNSTDQTDEIIKSYQSQFDRLVFYKRSQRCGVDRDILKSVKLAHGDYCWLFSADDHLCPGSIDRIISKMDESWNALITNFMLCDFNMSAVGPHEIVDWHQGDRVFDLSNAEQQQQYLNLARTSTALFSFISSVIIKRADWLAADDCETFCDTCWIIQAKAYAMMKNGMNLCYCPELLMNKRGDNDSFLSMGIARRIKLALEDFPDVAKTFWGQDSPIHLAAKRVTRNEISMSSLLSFKEKAHLQGDNYRELYEIVKQHWIHRRRDYFGYLILRFMPAKLIGQLKIITKKNMHLFKMIKKLQRAFDQKVESPKHSRFVYHATK
ncbi:glycosyltransferase family 2 protein [Poriferisphaera sp. WC338]|uniref:glycosyltransferase family 2 protein n=1 Tax=Poriferisphaera sp. WC338 TaxID=3425129 RepID=UPI003D813241